MSGKLVATAALVAVVLIGGAVFATFWLLGQPVPLAGSSETMAGSSATLPTVGEDPGEEPAELTPGLTRVRLYVLDASGTSLTTETEEIPSDATLQQQSRDVIRLLIRRSAAFPPELELRDVFITSQGVAYVDFSQELVENHPGGSSAEELTVYGLSNTLLANFPTIKLVRILVEGREIQSIAGHLDLTVPYGRAPNYLNPPSERSELPNDTN